ncbi:MAG: NAD-dependent epimerase/dehydratase family protein [Dehalococcoidia bacterium]|nr:MAG: NAD-dependent epimerase/dehydratase family protein [Dehalococcoidia bacterium]
MKTLVTGATGFLGSHVVELLIEQGHEVRALARRTSDVGHLENSGASIVFGDVEDIESLYPAVESVDAVIHAAARVLPGWGAWPDYESCIIKGTENLLQASTRAGVSRFLQFSSLTVYDRAYCSDIPFDESAPCKVEFKPVNYYDYAKLEADKLAFEFHDGGKLQVSVVRPGWVYGPRDRLLSDRIYRQLHMSIVALPGAANPRIPLVYATDVADCAVRAATSNQAAGQIYNVAPPHGVRFRDFIGAMARALGRPEPRIIIPYGVAYGFCVIAEAWARLWRVKEMPYLTRAAIRYSSTETLADASKAREELGWEPRVSVEEGTRLYAEWRISQSN